MNKPDDFITIKDEQTGLEYKIRLEDAHAARVAVFAMLYLLFMLMFLLWMLFDIWIGRNLLLGWLGYDRTRLAGNAFQLVAYVVIGGALGGALSGIRSIIFWHSQYRAYGPRFVWKDLALPLTGATLGIMVYAGVR